VAVETSNGVLEGIRVKDLRVSKLEKNSSRIGMAIAAEANRWAGFGGGSERSMS
jgi:hypothetical protein